MSFVQVLSAYINLQILILVGFVSLGISSYIFKKLQWQRPAASELRLHYLAMQLILFLTLMHPWLPHANVFTPAVHVWSSSSLKSFEPGIKTQGYLSIPTPRGPAIMATDRVAFTTAFLAFAALSLGLFFLFRDLRNLRRMQRQSFLIRQIGRVRIFANDQIHVPFSYWTPARANVVLPMTLINRASDYRMAILHELQHHRQTDTRWVYVLWGLKVVCFINPMIYLWNRWIAEIQEFACDEALVDQGKVQSQAYARCLIEVAQTALHQKQRTMGATRLTFLVERHLLKRRIERMFTKTSKQSGRPVNRIMAVLVITMMGATAYASKALVQDRRVSLEQAQSMAARAQSSAGFPIVVNDLVLKQLNRYMGTPEGREFMRNALARMENYRTMISQKQQEYGVPEELIAIPLIESGYQNLPQAQNSAWPQWNAAGIWQFIRSTAKNYGLRVNEQQDDRLNTTLLTDAAMRYLQSNHLRFRDWHLSLLAYNMGESAVQKGMDALGTRDAWTLIRNGHEGDKDYLPKLMAAILIMKNPESVQ